MKTIVLLAILIGVVFFFTKRKNRKSANSINNQAENKSGLISEEQEIEETTNSESERKQKSSKITGKFDVVGFHYLPEEAKSKIWKELKIGDSLELIADSRNTHDNEAIKVHYKGDMIGWVPKSYNKKSMIFQSLLNNDQIKTICTKNVRKGDYIRASRPDSHGEWNDKYLGMAQFVEVKYEIQKQ